MVRRTSHALLVTALLATASATLLPARAEAANIAVDEVYPRPADGIFRFDGHGWGHGRGLNQWGAQGAANSGVTATEILEAYYPGTASGTIANTPIRVLLEEDGNGDVAVSAKTDLALYDEPSRTRYVLPTGYTAWRVYRDANGFRVQGYTSGAWRQWGSGGKSVWTGPMRFEGASPLRLHFPDRTHREYRGVLRAVPSGSSVKTVNELSMEEYLYGVVPRESPSSFHVEALKAQTVAARSYSAYKRSHAPSAQPWHICSTIQCQVYGGIRIIYPDGTTVPLENSRTNAAVDATRNVVRTYNGAPIFAEFSSSNGGHSTASATFPYLAAKPDPWDAIASPHHDWEAAVPATQIEARYPSVGRLLRIRVTARDGGGEWGGRVKAVILEGVDSAGNATSVQSSGAGIYNTRVWPSYSDGLRGSWWKIRGAETTPDFSGSLVGLASRVVVRPAYTTEVYFDVKNTGNLEWPVRGAVRSATKADSPSYDEATWLTKQRAGSLTTNLSAPSATVVKPGQVARFVLRVAGNGRAEGDYVEDFGVVWEMKYWMALTVPVAFRIQLLFAGELVDAPESFDLPGWGRQRTHFDVRNTGDMAWPLSAPIHSTVAGTSPSVDSSWLNAGRPGRIGSNVTRPGADSVAVGEVARFPLVLNGNRRSDGAAVTERFGVVWEGRAHAAVRAPVPYVVRNVFTGSLAAAPSARVLVPASGTTAVTFDVTNTGNLDWPVRGPVRVWLRSPSSPSRAGSWLSSTRPGYLVANVTAADAAVVAPGETARFSFELAGNGRATGTRSTEYFGVAFEGVGYLGLTVPVSYEVRPALAGSLVAVTSPLYLPTSASDSALAYVDVRNDGVTDWPVAGMVRLTARSDSPSRTSSWIASTRPAAIAWNRSRPASPVVEPGQVARFAVRLSGNGRAAGTSLTEHFGVVYERVGYVPVSIPVRYTVRDVFAGAVVGRSADTVVVPRSGIGRVFFDVRNTGNIAWPVGSAVNSAVSSSGSASRAPSWLNAGRPGRLTANVSVAGAAVVAPGEVARFAFDLAGNGRAAGAYAEDFRVVWERRFWLPLVATLRYTIS